MNNPHTSFFGLYETIRILLPGFYFVSLCILFYQVFLSDFFSFSTEIWTSVLLFIFLVIVSGLTMYAKETTKRRRAFIENRPSTFLQDVARRQSAIQLLNETESLRLYFYILNHYYPPAFCEKIFFFGTIYHIIIHIRRTSFWFSILTLIAIAIQLSRGVALVNLQGLITLCILVWLIYLLNVKYNKADKRMQEIYKDQIFWLQMNEDLVKDLLHKHDISKKNISP
jgi:hypothetical protein